MTGFEALDREHLLRALEDAAKLWLAHDGLWFQAVEEAYGLQEALRLDEKAMSRFTAIEARRIKKRLNLPEEGGLKALAVALENRLYALINRQSIELRDDELLFKMLDCRVQAARQRKGLPAFPCKSVGIIEYREFAKVIDPRIEVECIACPPDPRPHEFWCGWRFTLRQPR